MTKDDAMNLIKLPFLETQNLNEYRNFFLKKLSLSTDEFDKIMFDKPKKHSDYDFDLYNNIVFKFLKNNIKKFFL